MKKNKLKNALRGIVAGAVLGMKHANDVMFSQEKGNDSDKLIGIEQQKHAENLGEALMRGEVTQEVEELRYRTYAVEREVKKMEYNIATGRDKKTNVPVITQENVPIISGIFETLRDGVIKDDWSIKIGCRNMPRYRAERYLKSVTIDKRAKMITYNFNGKINPEEATSAPFVNALHRVGDITSQLALDRDPIASNIESTEFTTVKCVGMEDYHYVKVTGVKCDINKLNYKDDGFTISITLLFEKYEEKNLASDFHSETMEEKYRTRAPRQNMERSLTFMEAVKENREEDDLEDKCDICGAKVDYYTAAITKYETGKIMCNKCYAAHMGVDYTKVSEEEKKVGGISNGMTLDRDEDKKAGILNKEKQIKK